MLICLYLLLLWADRLRQNIINKIIKMDNTKASTDIDRKLAIYYHPLFQQIIKIILDLFQTNTQKFEVGLLQFVQFNLKLQKALLPSFELDNALISGLNDWVKEVAECLSYEGMVSTTGCVQVTSSNVLQLTEKQYDQGRIAFFQKKPKYLEQVGKVSNHDAFKLLGVKINREVFSKFMFDLCSTWCEFLDVELFSYFLIGLYIQISEGETIQSSKFKSTLKITTIDLQFMEEFEEIKSSYGRVRRKELRYYRAWCEWNYLRVNEAGQRLILKLDQIHPDDNRILQLAMVFQRAIQVINEQITSQNPQREQKKRKTQYPSTLNQNQQNKDFLILKKLNIEPNQKQAVKQRHQNQQTPDTPQDNLDNLHIQLPSEDYEQIQQQFQIQIDEEGNMYLKRIVKLPVLGLKIQPKPFEEKWIVYKDYLNRKRDQFRQISNLYGKMESMKIRLEHNVKNDPYTFKRSVKIEERDKFYEQKKSFDKKNGVMDKTIHQKPAPSAAQKQQKGPEVPVIKIEEKASLRENKDYIHKVMAPTFLTDEEHNISYVEKKQGQIYSNSANDEKRQIRIGLPKLKNMQFRVKQIKSYHIVGKLVNDRSLIKQKVKSASIDMTKDSEQSKLDALKQENKHIWQRYLDEEEVKELNNYQQFYYKLQQAKQKFGRQFQSEFRVNFLPMMAYENKRYQLGGIITKQEQQRFSIRMQKLINKQNRRNRKKQRKQKLRQYRNNFKNKKQKSLYEDIFINYHKEALQELKQCRKRHSSMIAK